MADERAIAVSRENGEHYVWGDGCDGGHLMKSEELSVLEERMPPGTAEVRHWHRRAQQFFYVLSGRATMEIDGKMVEVGAGEGVHIPAGVAHQMKNESGEEARFLVISQPRTHGDRGAGEG
jgi:mannose-6-phosphate isomerase-like protein (cupin superfamily)